MISLKKGDIPSILVEKEGQWTAELMSYVQNGEKIPEQVKSRYRHQEIKNSLLKETNSKCAYCESKISHIDHGDIEHILPKSKVPEETFFWGNLTIGCTKCNQYKKDYYDENVPLLNPYSDNPEDKIIFLGPIPFPLPGSDSAYVTIKRLKLDRAELVERRVDLINSLQPLIRQYEKETNETMRNLLLEDIIERTQPDKEFSLMIRHMLDRLSITA